jgi:uncharacterized protein (DUF362 family)
MPTVAIAHSAERHRSLERVLSLVRGAVDRLGGMDAFVKPGQTVLLKPNQSVYCSAEEGCTTDPLVVGALIRLARLAGAARVQVAEASHGSFNSLDCMRLTGMAAIAEREGAEIIDLGSDGVPNRHIGLPEGRVLHSIPLPVPLLEADVVIAAPKAKNGCMDTISGAMELWMGVVNHGWREENAGRGDTVARFADIMALVRPDLCVTDALICGEGDGPMANLPHWCGCILASSDPVATDVTIARLMGRDWRKLRFAAAGEERGIGSREPLVWLGDPLERVAIQAWPGHEGYSYLPVNFLAGEGVTLEGTLGHVKSALDLLLRRGVLEQVIRQAGTPTIMAGGIEDPEFERHLSEGPYLVFDDAARPEYKRDHRVYFVPGHPVLDAAFPHLMRGLGVTVESGFGLAARQPGPWRVRAPGTAQRRLHAVAAPAAFAALAAGAFLGMSLARKA